MTFDLQGVLHTINWRAFSGGLQYYLPPAGRLIFAANCTYSHSNNLKPCTRWAAPRSSCWARWPTPRATPTPTCSSTRRRPFASACPGEYTQVHYLDGNKPHNIRGMGQAVYVF